MMRTMGRNPTEDELMAIMNEIDIDHNGSIKYFSLLTVLVWTESWKSWTGVNNGLNSTNTFEFFTSILIGKLDFSEFTMMMREKLTVDNVEEEIKLAFR